MSTADTVTYKPSPAGTTTLGLLGVLFIALRLMGYIDWSWWLVLLPFWGPFALLGAVSAIYLLVVFLVALLGGGK